MALICILLSVFGFVNFDRAGDPQKTATDKILQIRLSVGLTGLNGSGRFAVRPAPIRSISDYVPMAVWREQLTQSNETVDPSAGVELRRPMIPACDLVAVCLVLIDPPVPHRREMLSSVCEHVRRSNCRFIKVSDHALPDTRIFACSTSENPVDPFQSLRRNGEMKPLDGSTSTLVDRLAAAYVTPPDSPDEVVEILQLVADHGNPQALSVVLAFVWGTVRPIPHRLGCGSNLRQLVQRAAANILGVVPGRETDWKSVEIQAAALNTAERLISGVSIHDLPELDRVFRFGNGSVG